MWSLMKEKRSPLCLKAKSSEKSGITKITSHFVSILAFLHNPRSIVSHLLGSHYSEHRPQQVFEEYQKSYIILSWLPNPVSQRKILSQILFTSGCQLIANDNRFFTLLHFKFIFILILACQVWQVETVVLLMSDLKATQICLYFQSMILREPCRITRQRMPYSKRKPSKY